MGVPARDDTAKLEKWVETGIMVEVSILEGFLLAKCSFFWFIEV